MSKCMRRRLFLCFSSDLDRTDTIEIGLYFDGFALSPDLYRGITLAILKAEGKVLFIMQRLKTYVRVFVKCGAASRKILVSRPSRSGVPDCFKYLRAL